MKILSIEIRNIGIIEDTKIELSKPLLIFYGEIRQGKSTILHSVRWCLGGSFPAEIIRTGETEAHIEMRIDGGHIRREFYRSKKGKQETKARDIEFIRAGRPVPSPVAEIKRFLNPFLLNQDHLRDMNEPERKRFLVELLGVDTADLDKELYEVEKQASTLRTTIGGYGVIDLKAVEKVDVEALKAFRSQILDQHVEHIGKVRAKITESGKLHREITLKVEQKNASARQREADITAKTAAAVTAKREIARLRAELEEQQQIVADTEAWIANNPKIEALALPTEPDLTALREQIMTPADTSAVDTKLQEAGAQNVRHEQYLAAVEKSKLKEADEEKLAKLEKRGKEIKTLRISRLKDISTTCGIPELQFDDAGDFTFQGVSAGMLSTSQVMTLSELLSGRYPDGFGLSLLDRGESLGSSVFGLVERAKAEDKTILATVVGESPAKTPAQVGVFIVDKGVVTEKEGEKQLL